MNSNLNIRRVLSEDAEVLIRLTAQLGYICTKEELLERLIPYQNKTHGEVLVAVLDSTVVGWISLNVVRYFYVQPFIEVSGFVVEEKFRNKGIGKKLLEAAESWVKEQGYGLIRIRTNVLRTEAHRFYENNGYKKVKEQKVYFKETK
jgi:GNAT superfamily N-acetyltransferase